MPSTDIGTTSFLASIFIAASAEFGHKTPDTDTEQDKGNNCGQASPLPPYPQKTYIEDTYLIPRPLRHTQNIKN
eukprot:scaffold4142_cov158-Skeletonema_marinoi.AAC.6